ncbi:helix-turn-helix domain-containing protein [Nonomuraea cavernae]|uniref:helix-turn-helix domain-containing protein n=1 Tax=Nonomuraea cavernae TaxID=2045107 RepID=UPI0033DA1C6F
MSTIGVTRQDPTQDHTGPLQPTPQQQASREALQRPTMTVREAAAVLGVDRGAACAAVHRGELPALRIGRKILIPTAPIRAMLGMLPADGGQ